MSVFGSLQKSFVAKLIRFLFRIEIIGAENQPKNESAYVVCSNHSSNWDPVILGAATDRPIRYMAKKILFKIPLLNLLIKLFGAYPVERDTADIRSIKTTIELLKSGEVVGIYPQGSRAKKKHPSDSRLKNGAAMCAMRAGVGILPVSIITKGHKVKLFRKTRVVIGEFIPHADRTEADKTPENSGISLYAQKTGEIFSAILENYDKYDNLNKKADSDG